MSDGEPSEEKKRLDRNWNELLQELRVTQTGIQFMVGFLLTLPFTQRFAELTDGQVRIYLVLLCAAVATTGLFVAPAAFHRSLFRQQRKAGLVVAAHRCAQAGLVMFSAVSAGVVFLVFDVLLSRTDAIIGAGATLGFFAVLWGAVPFWLRNGDQPTR